MSHRLPDRRRSRQGRDWKRAGVVKLAMAGALACLLGACAQQPKTMYSWDSYQPAVYAYLQEPDHDVAVQAQRMERNVETARAADRALPPGFRGHLAMLYLKMGQDAKAVEQLEGEKQAFPESTPFVDFLTRSLRPESAATSAGDVPGVPATPSRQGGV